MNDRKKLCKLMGKDLAYTAIFASHKGTRAVLTDLKYKGKLLCDHVCVSYHYALHKLKHGTEVSFQGTAYTYRDKKQERKNGINKCYKYLPVDSAFDVVRHDNANKKKRVGK